MTVTLQQVQKLLTGNSSFSQLGFSMMLARLKNDYAKNPSQATLQKCMDEINAFLAKFSSIMANDYAIISKL